MTTEYAVAYDKITAKDERKAIVLGSFKTPQDAQSLLIQVTNEGKPNPRIMRREVSAWLDIDDPVKTG